MDEHAQGLISKILNKIFQSLEYMGDNVGEEHLLPILSAIGTVVFIVGFGYLMAYLVRIEEENLQKTKLKGNNNNTSMQIKFFITMLLKIMFV